MRVSGLFVLLQIICIGINAQNGYIYKGKFISVEPVDNNIYYINLSKDTDTKETDSNKIKSSFSFADFTILSKLSDKEYVISSKEKPENATSYISQYYKDSNNSEFVILPRVVMKLANSHVAETIAKEFNGAMELDTCLYGIYRWNCNLKDPEKILKLSCQISVMEGVKWCEPVKMSNIKSQNTYYPQQYYLHNTGQSGGQSGIDINVSPVWQNITYGSTNVVVAVIDDGVDLYHEDLEDNLIQGYTVGNSTGYGAPQNENAYSEKGHGTACAGIVAAQNNNIGIIGVASNVKILPVNVFPNLAFGNYYFGFASDELVADAIRWAYARADVLSCSWVGDTYSEDIADAISDAVTLGRNGKGCIVVFSAGNFGNNTDVLFPANLNTTIAVGAINNTGSLWGYSCCGSAMELVAPSGDIGLTGDIVTTDRMGNWGYNSSSDWSVELDNTNYTKRFGGTSAACPQVAGVAALMLSANPNLTGSEVRNILRYTARKLSGMNGLNWTNSYGYGLVDAYNAVINAMKLSISGSSHPCDNPVYSVTNLPAGYSVDWSLSPDVSILGTSILTTDIPQQNQCTIDSYDLVPWATSLRADVKNATGDTIVTLSKVIRNTFDVTFTQTGGTIGGITYPSIGPSTVSSTGTIAVNHRCGVSVESPFFDDMTISHSGASPSFFSVFDGSINFVFPTVASTQYMTITGRDGCRIMQLNVQVIPNPNIPIPMLEISPTANGYEIQLVWVGDDDAVRERTRSVQNTVWELNIVNATSGEAVECLRVKGDRTTISTTGWKPGAYVLQAFIDGQKTTKKMLVK